MWAELRRTMGPEAQDVLRAMCRDLGVESSKDLTLEQVNHILATVSDLADYREPPGQPDAPAPGEPTPERVAEAERKQ